MLSFSAAVELILIEDDLFTAGHLRAQGNVRLVSPTLVLAPRM
jgi:hypothetical protein